MRRTWWVAIIAILAVPLAQGQSRAEKDGRKVAHKVARAMRLKDRQEIRALRATFTEGEGESASTITTTIVEPDQLRAEVRSARGLLTIVVTPNLAFLVAPDGSLHDVPEYQKQESLQQIVRDPIYLASHWKDPEIRFSAIGTDQANGVPAQMVDVEAGAVKVRWFVEEKSGRLLREEYVSLGEHGRISAATELSDWRSMGGLVLPAKHENYQEGRPTSVVTQTGLELNPKVDAKAFARPEAKQ